MLLLLLLLLLLVVVVVEEEEGWREGVVVIAVVERWFRVLVVAVLEFGFFASAGVRHPWVGIWIPRPLLPSLLPSFLPSLS